MLATRPAQSFPEVVWRDRMHYLSWQFQMAANSSLLRAREQVTNLSRNNFNEHNDS